MIRSHFQIRTCGEGSSPPFRHLLFTSHHLDGFEDIPLFVIRRQVLFKYRSLRPNTPRTLLSQRHRPPIKSDLRSRPHHRHTPSRWRSFSVQDSPSRKHKTISLSSRSRLHCPLRTGNPRRINRQSPCKVFLLAISPGISFLAACLKLRQVPRLPILRNQLNL